MAKFDFDNLTPEQVNRLSADERLQYEMHWKRMAWTALVALKNQCVATIREHHDVVKALQKDVAAARSTVDEQTFHTIVHVLATFALTSNALTEMEILDVESQKPSPE